MGYRPELDLAVKPACQGTTATTIHRLESWGNLHGDDRVPAKVVKQAEDWLLKVCVGGGEGYLACTHP